MKFSTNWLALRATADRRARATDLMAMAAAVATSRCDQEVAEIVDLASGTGATMRALAPMISARKQHWTLVDADAGLLAEAVRLTEAEPPAENLAITTMVADLAAEPTPWSGVPDLVTASALFDLVSVRFVGRLAARLAADRIPLLAMLTYDGGMSIVPAHPGDAPMERAYNTHMRGEKSFGEALGPDAVTLLAQTLEASGFIVNLLDSAWRLTRADDAALIDALVANWAAVAAEVMPDERAMIGSWLEHARNAEELTVGHSDLLALP